MSSPTVISAPGKVLIAGGYLVLDPAYSGIVVSTSSRFYTTVQDVGSSPNIIVVRSPQFTNASWTYHVDIAKLLVQPSSENLSNNKFIHLALQHTLALAIEIKGASSVVEHLSKGLSVVIAGDNDFYSQRAKLESLGLPRTISSLSSIPPFAPTGASLANVHKTGLGSSAALITSLTTALLVHLSVIPISSLSDDRASDDGRRLTHNLAQFIHCVAQGKVGSGFDVSAATFGSHLYTRFDPAVIQDLMSDVPPKLYPVLSPSNKAWNYRVEDFKLPPYTRIMLADVDAGSDTPSLVGKVLKWRQQNVDEANALWKHLDQLNQTLAQTLLHLSRLHDQDPTSYKNVVRYISSLQPVQWEANPLQPAADQPVINGFFQAHKISQEIRAKMKEMGALAGVPIEPDEQTRLLDVCVSQAGVVGGGVPGAGGYDAIWLLICEPGSLPDQSPLERVEYVWSTYTELSVSPLSSKESFAKGVRVEKVDEVPGLKALLE